MPHYYVYASIIILKVKHWDTAVCVRVLAKVIPGSSGNSFHIVLRKTMQGCYGGFISLYSNNY